MESEEGNDNDKEDLHRSSDSQWIAGGVTSENPSPCPGVPHSAPAPLPETQTSSSEGAWPHQAGSASTAG